MNKYDKFSREELIGRIQELEKTVERQAAEKDGYGQTEIGNGRFKEKYALKILDSLPDMLTVLSPEGTLVDLVSSEETNHVGTPGDNIRGKDISEILSPEAYKNVKDNLDLVVETGKGSTSHHDITLDGETRNYENRIFMLDTEHALCMCRDITEEQKAKRKLEEANRRMDMAENIASLSHWYYYEDTDTFEDNTLIPKILNSKEKKNCRWKLPAFLAYVHTADREKIIEQITHPDTNDEYTEFRLFIDGEVHHFHSRVIHVNHINGKKVIEGYTQDMTHMVERLNELEAMKYAINNITDEIFACDVEGNMKFANQQFMTHNKVKGDLTAKKAYEYETILCKSEEWDKLVQKLKENAGSRKYTVQYKGDDGKIGAMEIGSYLIADEQKGKEIIWFFGRDISLRINQENKIKEMNSLMDTILNNIPVCLFVKDPGNEFRYLYWNKAFAEYSHIPAEKALGRTDYEIFPNPKDAEHFRRDDLKLLQLGERIDINEEYDNADGKTRIVTTSKTIVPAENRLPLIIGISWDITDLKNTERALIEARNKAEESDKLKSAFLANMSHEIRTPLNAIVGFSKLMAETNDNNEKVMYAEIIDTNSDLLLQLINDILDISKIEAGTIEFNYRTVNPADICRSQYEIHKNRVKDGVTLVFNDKNSDVLFRSDSNRLSQILTNLITNAIKFTTRGEICFGFNVNEKTLDFYVSDTGSGIPSEKQKTIFNRFVKLNNFATGSGLGLAITKMLVEKMNGTISVESTEGSGTIFRFSLPRTEGKPSDEETDGTYVSDTSEKDDGRKRNILVAEDIDSNYMLVQALLGKNFNLFRAMNGEEAVKMYDELKPDIILMDLKMPVMDGFEATRQIREKSKTLPIIAMSAFAYNNDVEKAKAAGCNDYITKPVSPKILKDKLNYYLYGK